MTATLEQTDNQAGQTDQLRKKYRLLTRAVVGFAVLAVGLAAWGVWQAPNGDDAAATTRYENAKANQETMMATIADPTAFGTEEEVLDRLDSMAIPDVVSGDLAFGGTMAGIWRTGWRNTLYASPDMSVKIWRYWLSDDGSVGGSLWTWYGIADNGETFAIPGVEISRFNDEGLWEELVMFYPFEDDEVHRRVGEGN